MSGFEYFRRELEKLRRKLHEEIEKAFTEPLLTHRDWSPDGSLEPLYNIYEYSDRYVVLVDLAGADKGSIEVKATEDRLIVEARLERTVTYSDVYGTHHGREITFHSYRHELPLPPDADPSGMKVNIRPNKLIEIVLPKKRQQGGQRS